MNFCLVDEKLQGAALGSISKRARRMQLGHWAFLVPSKYLVRYGGTGGPEFETTFWLRFPPSPAGSLARPWLGFGGQHESVRRDRGVRSISRPDGPPYAPYASLCRPPRRHGRP